MMLLAPTITATTSTMKTIVLAKPEISPPQIKVAPAATIAITDIPVATGPEIDCRTCCSGDSHGSAFAVLAMNMLAINAIIKLKANCKMRGLLIQALPLTGFTIFFIGFSYSMSSRSYPFVVNPLTRRISFTRRPSLVLAIKTMILMASAITLGIGVEEVSATSASMRVRPDLASLA